MMPLPYRSGQILKVEAFSTSTAKYFTDRPIFDILPFMNLYRNLGNEPTSVDLSQNFTMSRRLTVRCYHHHASLEFSVDPIFQQYVHSPELCHWIEEDSDSDGEEM